MTGRIKNVILALVLLVLPAAQASSQESYFIHTVAQGQGLYSIARTYGVTENDIIKLNPGSEKVIRAGQELKIPRREQQVGALRYHTVQKGETLYRLSVENRVSVKDICDANPGLSAENFKIGQVIVIPPATDEDPLASTFEAAAGNLPQETVQATETLASETPKYRTTHVVERRETIYRICKDYGITQAEFLDANPELKSSKLRKGMTVNIPFSSTELIAIKEKIEDAMRHIESIPDSTLFSLNDAAQETDLPDILTAAVLMPFCLDDTVSVNQKMMVEFYQGVLLALERLKDEGISVNLKVLDTGSESHSINGILTSDKMKDVNIVFGPRYAQHIAQASEWSLEHGVPLVILPANSNTDEVFDNPNVFQINTPQSYFMQEVYNHFFRQFPNPKVIVLDAEEYNRNPFLDGLERELKNRGMSYEKTGIDTAPGAIADILDPTRDNIFIINSSGSAPLSTILPTLQLVSRMKDPSVRTMLFGYPEYQIYAPDHLEEFYEVNTWFYSSFYTNNMLQEAASFGASFRRAFSRQMMVSYPSFAAYGYDMAYHFLKCMATYGNGFESHINDTFDNPVQTGFKFERVNNWGGFVNRKVFFIHLSDQYTVEKIDFDR